VGGFINLVFPLLPTTLVTAHLEGASRPLLLIVKWAILKKPLHIN